MKCNTLPPILGGKMSKQLDRTRLLFGEENLQTLKSKKILLVGLGGVGGHTMEALARSGIGAIDIMDFDTVDISNLNRQLIATQQTVGQKKVKVGKERIESIDPSIKVNIFDVFYSSQVGENIDFTQYDYVIDAIDNVTGKINLIQKAKEAGVPVISAMGAGNKMDPTAFKVADIEQTQMCPLARVMRKELKKRNINGVKVVYSTEKAVELKKPSSLRKEEFYEKPVPGSNAFVPATLGLIIASEVVKDLIGWNQKSPCS